MIALVGSGVDKISIVDKETAKEVWSYKLPSGSECNSVAVLPTMDVIFSYKQGVMMVSEKGKTIWDFPVEKGQEAQTLALLPSGKILVGVCASPMRIIELDRKGRLVSEVNYDLGVEKAHSQFRQMTKASNGNYLVPVLSQAKVVEISPKGEKVREISVPPTPFSIKEMPNGNLLVSTIGQLVILDRRTGEKTVTLLKGPIQGTRDTLRFATEAVVLKNGNVVATNWQGYARTKSDAQVIELDAEGRVVYTFRDTSIMKNVSGLFLFQK